MAYRIDWMPETDEEFGRFSKKFKITIRDKVKNVAANWPNSRNLRTIVRVRGQEALGYLDNVFELKVGSGPRVAFVVDEEQQLFRIYMVGTHEYCKDNYLKALRQRVE